MKFNFLALPLFLMGFHGLAFAQPAVDHDWEANAVLKDAKSYTVVDIGACQGVSLISNRLYFYGDRHDVSPRVGVIREYSLTMKSTGRNLTLASNGKPLLTHPTGIAYLDKNNVLIGDTVNQKAKIYLLDWERAWKEGTLDQSVKAVIEDDLAINGCRPLTVVFRGKRLIATADYGRSDNEIRLYNPEKLVAAKKTSDQNVLFVKFRCGAFNQNLCWHAEKKQIICIQNVVAGRGWRLQMIDLERAIAMRNGLEPTALENQFTFPSHNELEGFRILPNGKMIFVTAHKIDNVWIGSPESIAVKISRKGHELPFFK